MKHTKNFLENSNEIPKKTKAHKLRKREIQGTWIKIVKLICENSEIFKMNEMVKVGNENIPVL